MRQPAHVVWRLAPAAIVLPLLAVAACSESGVREVPTMSLEEAKRVLDSYRPRTEKLLQNLRVIQSALGDYSPRPKDVTFDPLPILRNTLRPDGPRDTNVAILAEETLGDFETRGPLDLKFDYKLRRLLKMTVANAIESIGPDFRQEIEDALAVRYLVILRTERYVPARERPPSGFESGLVVLRAFITDVSSARVLTDLTVTAESSKTLEFRRDVPQTLNGALEDDLRQNAKKAVRQALAEKTGGQFDEFTY
jgi:hypothetical protein